jgi:hypothetical protein
MPRNIGIIIIANFAGLLIFLGIIGIFMSHKITTVIGCITLGIVANIVVANLLSSK